MSSSTPEESVWFNLDDEGRLKELRRRNASELETIYGLPKQFFSLEKERLLNKPMIGKGLVRTLSALPTKRVIRNKASTTSAKDAFCEIIDNVFDNFEEEMSAEKGRQRKDLKIEFKIFSYQKIGEIQIFENSGGIKEEKLRPLVRLGEPKHDIDLIIGTWGEGFKVAYFALGKYGKVFTHYPKEKEVCVEFPEGWINDDESWNVNTRETKGVKEGTTLIVINDIYMKKLPRPEEFQHEVIDYIGETYGQKIKKYDKERIKVKITFKYLGEEYIIEPITYATDEDVIQNMCFPPEYEPVKVHYEWKKGSHELKVTILFGFTPDWKPTSGVWMWGNNRLFAKHLRDHFVGYTGTRRSTELPDHVSSQRFHAYVLFEGKNEEIPWKAPTKFGYNPDNVFAEEIKEAVYNVAINYVAFAKIAKKQDTFPYSEKWNEERNRETVILPETVPSDRKRHVKKYPKIVSSFKAPRYIREYWFDQKKKVFKNEKGNESFGIAKFNYERSTEIAKFLRKRRNFKEIKVLKVLNPSLFRKEEVELGLGKIGGIPKVSKKKKEKIVAVSIRVPSKTLEKLEKIFSETNHRKLFEKMINKIIGKT